MAGEHPIFWHNVHHGLFLLEKELKDLNFIPDVIVAVGRGGLVPGTLFAYRLNISNVINYSVKTYSDDNKNDLFNIIQSPNNNISDFKGKNVLVFDDLSDTGNTLKYIVNSLKADYNLQNVKSATLAIKDKTTFIPDFYISSYPSTTWLVFPWEVSSA